MKSHKITNNEGKIIAEIFLCIEMSSGNKQRLLNNIKLTIKQCSSVITKKISIFIFSTHDIFVIRRMSGVAGFSDMKNLIILNVSVTKDWEKALRETVAHETAHALALNYNKRITLGDNLVFEGIAEHFREQFLGGGRARWVKSLSKKQAKIIFNKIKKSLGSKSDKLYWELFFGTGKYPLWAGYAIGYYLVNEYLKKQDKVDWKKIIKVSPSEVIKVLEQNI